VSRPERVRVRLGERSYDIAVGEGLLARAGALLRPILQRPDVLIVTDPNLVRSGHASRLGRSLEEAGIRHRQVVVPPGEQSKSLAQLDSLLDEILGMGVERSTTIVALGGGVIGDLAGFAAAILLRGLDYVQVPTTLLAQVDSAVGGKTGINSTHGKNLIGSFHQPRLVVADTGVLASLPPRELRAGYAEVVKYGLIDRPGFFEWLERHAPALLAGDPQALRHAILESCRAKAAIVAADEREGGARALLNLGHSFAHALETVSGYGEELLHGEAVACGMALAFALSARLGLCPSEDVARVRRHLDAAGLPSSRRAIRPGGFATEALLAALAHDKKVRDGRPRFVLVRGIGKAFAGAEVEPADLQAMLDAPEP
jgi:3-dehydroquinate synthase